MFIRVDSVDTRFARQCLGLNVIETLQRSASTLQSYLETERNISSTQFKIPGKFKKFRQKKNGRMKYCKILADALCTEKRDWPSFPLLFLSEITIRVIGDRISMKMYKFVFDRCRTSSNMDVHSKRNLDSKHRDNCRIKRIRICKLICNFGPLTRKIYPIGLFYDN